MAGRMENEFRVWGLGFLLAACAPMVITDPPFRSEMQFLHVQGASIADPSGRPVMLRGIAFGNQVWDNVGIPSTHHAEVDYARVAAMGMNSVRFYLNAGTFEDPAAPGKYKAEGWASSGTSWPSAPSAPCARWTLRTCSSSSA